MIHLQDHVLFQKAQEAAELMTEADLVRHIRQLPWVASVEPDYPGRRITITAKNGTEYSQSFERLFAMRAISLYLNSTRDNHCPQAV